MDFQLLHDQLVAQGYTGDTADAKIAHDVVLAAVEAAGFRDNLTVKGGVVMSELTDMVRRATMDMDVDFVHYSISKVSVRHFVAVLNRASSCRIQVVGEIADLRHLDYRGKRLHLKITDGKGVSVRTKLDIGVHTWADVQQADLRFKVVTDTDAISLLVNPKEQIFVEKLKSLLRIGPVSTRYKDVYDLYYLKERVRRPVLQKLLDSHVFKDESLRETNVLQIAERLKRIFADRRFAKGLANPNFAWLDVPSQEAAAAIVEFVRQLSV
ncbi:MAG: nucleotidyl transferase AbiEii/AbiGii toxin family protein [bacterium]|nr:nucleotidyl transferase AbiEii/AbiGii toxin family protein [bacterium]